MTTKPEGLDKALAALSVWPDETIVVLADYLRDQGRMPEHLGLLQVRRMAHPHAWTPFDARERELALKAERAWDEWPIETALHAILGRDVSLQATAAIIGAGVSIDSIRPDGLPEILRLSRAGNERGVLRIPKLQVDEITVRLEFGSRARESTTIRWGISPSTQPLLAGTQINDQPTAMWEAYEALDGALSMERKVTPKTHKKALRTGQAHYDNALPYWQRDMGRAVADILQIPWWVAPVQGEPEHYAMFLGVMSRTPGYHVPDCGDDGPVRGPDDDYLYMEPLTRRAWDEVLEVRGKIEEAAGAFGDLVERQVPLTTVAALFAPQVRKRLVNLHGEVTPYRALCTIADFQICGGLPEKVSTQRRKMRDILAIEATNRRLAAWLAAAKRTEPEYPIAYREPGMPTRALNKGGL